MRDERLEEAAERWFWGVVLRAVWSALVVALALAVLVASSARLAWRDYALLCFAGLLAGACVSAAMRGTARSRDLTNLVLGAVTLPALAVHLAMVAATDRSAFEAESAALVPFFACGVAGAAAGFALSVAWRGLPQRPPRSQAGEAEPQELLGPRPVVPRQAGSPPAYDGARTSDAPERAAMKGARP